MIVYVLTSYDDGETQVVGAFPLQGAAIEVALAIVDHPLQWSPYHDDGDTQDGPLLGMPEGGLGDEYFLVTKCTVVER